MSNQATQTVSLRRSFGLGKVDNTLLDQLVHKYGYGPFQVIAQDGAAAVVRAGRVELRLEFKFFDQDSQQQLGVLEAQSAPGQSPCDKTCW